MSSLRFKVHNFQHGNPRVSIKPRQSESDDDNISWDREIGLVTHDAAATTVLCGKSLV
jgi:hypothetical protein